jgi:microsomal dipeptidase-like Zn-dependent dipeptidase
MRTPTITRLLEQYRNVAVRRGVRFVVVRLLCSEEELSRRIQGLERVGRKLVDPVDAITNVRNYTVLDPNVSDTLTLDTTNLSPEVAAAAILAHISAQSGLSEGHGQEASRSAMITIFDGHNDTIHRLREFCSAGIDFLTRSSDGHLDLPRALEGGLVGGLFAMFVRPEHAPTDDLVVTTTSYEVRLADPLDANYARRKTMEMLEAFRSLEARADGKVRIATSTAEIEAARWDGSFAIVLHMEGADAIDADLIELEKLYHYGLRSLGLVWSRPNIFGGVPFAWPRSPDTGPGLSPAGYDLVRACNSLGIMIDVSHLNEKGFWDVARLSNAPLVATHSCAQKLDRSTARRHPSL